ncbi:HNH endonuclease [Oecophyllibacter saccharovorans]|uniref:HNH endonuclease n=1 Tax=Oecophyllibacter saccharovorans TaxID=2558360 RepID=A0A506UR00_9PROT|nr:HNH endonuclease [Oecophyllibacter saccharovorans]QDH14583.1 HNH endonuclease [Oecophyllibacter saccharovorans]TPW34782.1 HNH endonuclease [Oecophyllibacter saccharovorans]TPW35722.1 HNH endonuclease [Oecophyllibacter saccharovorans]
MYDGRERGYPALVLNADFRPLAYFPLSLWPWQEAVRAVFLNRVTVLSAYEKVVHSPTRSFPLPSVVALREYVAPQRKPAFTRLNVFLRDNFTCQYCNTPYTPGALTFDHVVPRSRGGRTSWTNIVTACSSCNLHKGARTPAQAGFTLRTPPLAPSFHQLQENGRHYPPHHLHESWRDYLYWHAVLES